MRSIVKKFLESSSLTRHMLERMRFRKNGNTLTLGGKNNRIEKEACYLHTVHFDIQGNDNVIRIAQEVQLTNLRIYIRGDRHTIEINENCCISGCLWIQENGGSIIIGKNTTIERAHLAALEGKSITIGEDCMLSHDIEFRTGDSHSILEVASGERINPAKDIRVGNHVWIGARSVILKGVTLGDDAIVGANSVVTKDIPARTIAVGTPARVIKEGTTWSRDLREMHTEQPE